jgi:hypothetical protein
MKNLVYKEFRLTIHPSFLLMSLFGALVLIPQWLYFFALMYFFFFSVPNIFSGSKAQNDLMFTALLPVRRRDIVKARVLSMALLELLQLVVTAAFVLINMAIYPQGSFMLDANIAYIGFGFMIYGIFNLIMLPMFYKTAYKTAIPITVATAVVMLIAAGIEMLVLLVPAARVLDGTQHIGLHLGVLAVGIALFFGFTVASYRLSVKRFEKVDL